MNKNRLISILMVLFLVAFSIPAFAGKPYISGRGDKNISTLYPHHEAHGGNMFSTTYNEDLGSAALFTMLINVPTTDSFPHMLIELRSSGEAMLEIYEGVTVSAVGTNLDETNHNRNNIKVAGVAITNGPTATNGGTLLNGLTRHTGAGQTKGGESRANDEVILKSNTLYILNATSEASSNDVTVHVTWYESDDSY